MIQRCALRSRKSAIFILAWLTLPFFHASFAADSLNVTLEFVSIHDTTILKGVTASFPYPVLSVITVLNKRKLFVHGLADTSRWLMPSDTATNGLPVDQIWKSILEYHQENPAIPDDPDVKNLGIDTTYMVTEVKNLEGFGISVAMAMDYSTSMGTDIAVAEDAARTFIRQKEPLDRMAIVKFNGAIRVYQELTSDTTELMDEIPKKPKAVAGTAFYDALIASIDLCQNEVYRSAVMAYTDGIDNASTNTMHTVIAHAQEKRIPIFIIGLGGKVDKTVLQTIADSTGGVYRYASSAADLETIYFSIYGLITGFYVLAHHTTDPFTNGTVRVVDITVDQNGVQGRGTGTYQVPFIPPDLEVTKNATADPNRDPESGSYVVFPGDTVSYKIAVTNNGPGLAGDVRIVDVLPDSMRFLGSDVPPVVSADSVSWQVDMMRVGETRTFHYEAVVEIEIAPWDQIPLVNNVQVTCPNDANSSNNAARDTIFVVGSVFPKPSILLFPSLIEPADTIGVEVMSPVRALSWDLWVLYANGSRDTTYADAFIESTILYPETWIQVEPDLMDTGMRTSKKEEIVRVLLITRSFWNESQTDTAQVTIRSADKFYLDQNTFEPDDGTPLALRFKLSSNRNARIRIYDISGAFIKEVINGPYPAGWNTVYWDGRNEQNRIVGSGTYVAILSSSEFEKARKFILIR